VFLGLFFESFHNGRLGRLERLHAYGVENGWKLGEGGQDRTLLTPNMVRILARIIAKLGGTEHEEEMNYPSVWPSGLEGYEAHLQVLSVLLLGEVDGKITKEMRERLDEHYGRNRDNGLFAAGFHRYADGDFEVVASSLLNESWFPSERLPHSNDRCEEYLFQRELGSDWEPCDEDITHSGSDYLFVAGLLEKWNGR
jgi:hypothetical protein